MQHYYNFTISENEMSYEPYWYKKSNIMVSSMLGITILGIISLEQNHLSITLPIAFVLLFSLIINCVYSSLILNKTTFLFDKNNDALYRITPLGKKKITSLSEILNVFSKSRSNSFHYILTAKEQKTIKIIQLTQRIKYSDIDNPEVRYLQMVIFPHLELFLDLNNENTIVFNSEDYSLI